MVRPVRHAKDFGLVLPGEPVVDYTQMAARRDQVVKRMWTGLKSLVDKNKVTWVEGRGRLDGPGRVRVSQAGEDGTPGAGGERILQATDIILATGSRVKSLAGIVPDGKRIVTSDDVLKMDTLPKDIVIVGAGAVGVEFASRSTTTSGTQVTLLEYLPGDRAARGPRRQPGARAQLHQARHHGHHEGPLRRGQGGGRQGRHLRGRRARRAARPRSSAPRSCSSRPAARPTSRTSASRRPRSRSTAASSRSTAGCGPKEPHVYAIGDIVGGLWLAHTAAHEGIVAAHVIAGDKDVHEIDYVKQPRATYCRPEIASIGLTEQQCEERGLPIKVGKVPFQAIAKALIGGEYEGFAKVIGHAETDDTLGVHIIGPARHRTSSPRRRSPSSSRRRRGRSAPRRTPTRRCPRSSARRRWPSTADRSTSELGTGGPIDRWP